MICLLVLGIFIVVNADVAPPAHQPRIDVPGASSKGTSFSANEFYGAGGTKINYPLPDCYTNESGFMCCNAELEEEMHKSYDDLRNRPEWISCNVQAITNTVQKRAEARFGLPFEVITGISDFASKAHFYHNYICKLEREGRIILAYATPKNGGDLTKLESAGIPGVGGKIEGAAPAGGTSAGASVGGASEEAGGVGAGPVGPQGGHSGANAGVGGFGGASEGAGGIGAGPVGPQGGNSGANAGVGGSVDSDDFGRALAATRGEQVGSAAGANANAAAAPRGEEQAGSAAGANAGVGVSSQGGKLVAPYKLTRISALQK